MRIKRLHPWNLKPKQAIRLQERLQRRIVLSRFTGKLTLIAGADAAFKDNKATGAVVVLSFPEFKVIEKVRKVIRLTYPYVPTILSFREGPVLEKCFKELKNKPDVIIFDGQGLAHPRKMGLAMHMGILLDRSTIGCAKTRLYGDYTESDKRRGAFTYLFDGKQEKIGAVLCTRNAVKPLFVSAGYKMDLDSAVRLVLMCTTRYRLPEPIRLAHQLCK